MVDLEVFRQDVYQVVGAIPSGKVLTYGQIAWLVGFPKHARLVGHVLHGVSEELHLPCHRVVNSAGRLVPKWIGQREMLLAEGVAFKPNGCVDMKKAAWKVVDIEN